MTRQAGSSQPWKHKPKITREKQRSLSRLIFFFPNINQSNPNQIKSKPTPQNPPHLQELLIHQTHPPQAPSLQKEDKVAALPFAQLPEIVPVSWQFLPGRPLWPWGDATKRRRPSPWSDVVFSIRGTKAQGVDQFLKEKTSKPGDCYPKIVWMWLGSLSQAWQKGQGFGKSLAHLTTQKELRRKMQTKSFKSFDGKNTWSAWISGYLYQHWLGVSRWLEIGRAQNYHQTIKNTSFKASNPTPPPRQKKDTYLFFPVHRFPPETFLIFFFSVPEDFFAHILHRPWPSSKTSTLPRWSIVEDKKGSIATFSSLETTTPL